jgi:hypothetical protein
MPPQAYLMVGRQNHLHMRTITLLFLSPRV